MEVKAIKLAGKFAGLFASSTLLIIGSIVLLKAMSLDYGTVIYACKFSISAAAVTGILGYFIGKIFENVHIDKNTAKYAKKDKKTLTDDIINKEIDSE